MAAKCTYNVGCDTLALDAFASIQVCHGATVSLYSNVKMCDGSNFPRDKRNNKYTLMPAYPAYIITSIQLSMTATQSWLRACGAMHGNHLANVRTAIGERTHTHTDGTEHF